MNSNCQYESHLTQIYDWMGLLEEYTVYIQKFKSKDFSIGSFWNQCDFFINTKSQVIYKIGQSGFQIYSPTSAQLEILLNALNPKITNYKNLLGKSILRKNEK